jgi:nitrite reductase/ring-hydroxylating ferredoxin subunit
MRARILLALVLTCAAVFAGVAAIVALQGSRSATAGVVDVDIARLDPGKVMPLETTLPGQPKWSRRVFVVHQSGDGVAAFLGRSTHLGCRLWFRGDPRFGEGLFTERGVAFYDPCGGSTYALDGACIGGPCPRGLDHYRVDVRDGTAEINVTRLIKGRPRGS